MTVSKHVSKHSSVICQTVRRSRPQTHMIGWVRSVFVTVTIKWLLDDKRHMYRKALLYMHWSFNIWILIRHEGWALIGWRAAEQNSWLAASPCGQLVADAAAVCDDLTETQLQVNLSLRRRERERYHGYTRHPRAGAREMGERRMRNHWKHKHCRLPWGCAGIGRIMWPNTRKTGKKICEILLILFILQQNWSDVCVRYSKQCTVVAKIITTLVL